MRNRLGEGRGRNQIIRPHHAIHAVDGDMRDGGWRLKDLVVIDVNNGPRSYSGDTSEGHIEEQTMIRRAETT